MFQNESVEKLLTFKVMKSVAAKKKSVAAKNGQEFHVQTFCLYLHDGFFITL